MIKKKGGESMRQRKKEMFLLFMLLLMTGSVASAQTSSSDENSAATSDVTAKSEEKQERTAVLNVVSITGNELTYYEEETEPEEETETEAKTEAETETEGETKAAPPSARQSSDMPDMPQLPEGAAPDFSQNGDTPSGNAPSQPPISEGAPTDLIQNAAGLTTKTVYLPVPVIVHTDDGDRTFSILEAGDQLQATILTDEAGNETITELWLLGTSEESVLLKGTEQS